MMRIGLILAGGRATRLGGADKGLVPFQGEPLALRAYRRLSPQVDRILVSANRSFDEYRKVLPPDTELIPDRTDSFPGPLAGLEAAIAGLPEKSRNDTWVFTVPCDCPFSRLISLRNLFPQQTLPDPVPRLQRRMGRFSPRLPVSGQTSFLSLRTTTLPAIIGFGNGSRKSELRRLFFPIFLPLITAIHLKK